MEQYCVLGKPCIWTPVWPTKVTTTRNRSVHFFVFTSKNISQWCLTDMFRIFQKILTKQPKLFCFLSWNIFHHPSSICQDFSNMSISSDGSDRQKGNTEERFDFSVCPTFWLIRHLIPKKGPRRWKAGKKRSRMGVLKNILYKVRSLAF